MTAFGAVALSLATGTILGFFTPFVLEVAFSAGGQHLGNWNLALVGGWALISLPFWRKELAG